MTYGWRREKNSEKNNFIERWNKTPHSMKVFCVWTQGTPMKELKGRFPIDLIVVDASVIVSSGALQMGSHQMRHKSR